MKQGDLGYFEVPVSDLARAADFYEAVFGWQVRRDEGPYWGVVAGDGDMGGLVHTDPVTPAVGGVLPYVVVDDLDKTIELAGQRGGRVDLGRTRIPGESGWYAHVRDPDGNRFGLWSTS